MSALTKLQETLGVSKEELFDLVADDDIKIDDLLEEAKAEAAFQESGLDELAADVIETAEEWNEFNGLGHKNVKYLYVPENITGKSHLITVTQTQEITREEETGEAIKSRSGNRAYARIKGYPEVKLHGTEEPVKAGTLKVGMSVSKIQENK